MTTGKLSLMSNSSGNRSTFRLTFKRYKSNVKPVDRKLLNINLQVSAIKEGVCARIFGYFNKSYR